MMRDKVKGKGAVFLDRDGVVNKVLIRDGKVYSPRALEEFNWEIGVQEAIRRLKEMRFMVIVVTNQPDIARGKISQNILDAMTEKIYSTLSVDAVLVCPHDDRDECTCRKPKAGMILEAIKKWDIDCQSSFVIGDSWKDMVAGQAAGCTTILLDRFYNQETECDHKVGSLEEAANLIIKTKL